MTAKGNPPALHFVLRTSSSLLVSGKRSGITATSLPQNFTSSRLWNLPTIKWRDCAGARAKAYSPRRARTTHGYDAKYAMHVIRLYLEAIECMQTGKITLPNPKVDLLVPIWRGKYKRDEIEELGKKLQAQAYSAQEKSSLPSSLGQQAITRMITQVYVDFR
jgi:hypothetical protein